MFTVTTDCIANCQRFLYISCRIPHFEKIFLFIPDDTGIADRISLPQKIRLQNGLSGGHPVHCIISCRMSDHGPVVSICHRIISFSCIKQVVLAFCKQNKWLANSCFPFQLWTPYQGIAKISSVRVKCVTDHIGFGFCFFLRYPVFCERSEIQSVFSYRHQDFFQKPMTVVQMKSIFYWKEPLGRKLPRFVHRLSGSFRTFSIRHNIRSFPDHMLS